MKTRIFSILFLVVLFSQICFAQLCSVLKDVRCGETHTLAVDDSNNLWACGSSANAYAMGLGYVGAVSTLQRVKGPNGNDYFKNVKSFDAGFMHSLVADSNGYCWAFGDDGSGQLGNGPNEGGSSVPIKVYGLNNDASGLQNIAKVSAGRSGLHSLAVDSYGYVYAWGLNSLGQCGNGNSQISTIPSPILVLSTGADPNFMYLGDEAFIVNVNGGMSHSLALVRFEDGGFIYEWGDNVYNYPHKVRGENGNGYLKNIIDIGTCDRSYAVDANGNVWSWTTGNYPEKVPGGDMGTTYLEHIRKVAVGFGFCLALDSNDNVWQWYTSGQPEKVLCGQMNTQSGYLEDIVALDGGYNDYRVAIDRFGRGWAWGADAEQYAGTGGVVSPDPMHPPIEMACADVSPPIYLTKTSEIQGDEPNCANPFTVDNYLIYDINYGNPITNPSDPNYFGTVYDVNIVDLLPLEVDFYSATGGGVYDANTHTVKWTIGELEPGDVNSLTITTKVNYYAHPGGQLQNFSEMTADKYYSDANDSVLICNWGGSTIYVDKDATSGYNNGTSWEDAYLDLRDAFTEAHSSGNEKNTIWVAAGTYKPVYDMNDPYYYNQSFEMIDGISIYGHFDGNETALNQRDFNDANNETILEGKIGQYYYDGVSDVVKATGVEDVVIDGFTIKGAYQGNPSSGIYLDDASVSVKNCGIGNNHAYGVCAVNYSHLTADNCTFTDSGSGIYSDSSELDVNYCTFDGGDTADYGLNIYNSSISNIVNSVIRNHTEQGICNSGTELTLENCEISQNEHDGLNSSGALTVNRCVFAYNGLYGILSSGGLAVIKNNLIYHNFYGIFVQDSNTGSIIRNNTIADNDYCGIYFSGETTPAVSNCIIWDNSTNLYGISDVNYCRLDSLSGINGTGNKINDPCFVDDTNDDYHITYDSNCINAGDPCGNYNGELDIDNQSRVMGKSGQCGRRVDIGADETFFPICWNCITQCHGDTTDCDGDVDTIDWPEFRDGFGTDYPQQEYLNHPCGDLDHDGTVGTIDWPEFRYWFGKESVPGDCGCGGTWPPDENKGMSSGGFDESFIEDVLKWLDEIAPSEKQETTWTKEEYLKFKENIENWLKEL